MASPEQKGSHCHDHAHQVHLIQRGISYPSGQALAARYCSRGVCPFLHEKNVALQQWRMCFAIFHMKSAHFAALATIFFLSNLTTSHASEEEHKSEEEHHSLDTSSVWGYSFLFTFIGCLPSACAIVICLCFRMSISDKIISSMMAFASGVSAASFLAPHQ